MATLLFRGRAENCISLISEFSGRNIEVFEAENDEVDYSENMPDPPFTVRYRAHLFELLDAGLASPTERVTEKYWADVHAEVQRRYEERNKQK